MKIRNGFVSNSSSSSFVILGQKYSLDEIQDALKDYEIEISPEAEEDFDFDDYIEILEHDLPGDLQCIEELGGENEFYIGLGGVSDYEIEVEVDVLDFDKFKGDKPIKLYGGEYAC